MAYIQSSKFNYNFTRKLPMIVGLMILLKVVFHFFDGGTFELLELVLSLAGVSFFLIHVWLRKHYFYLILTDYNILKRGVKSDVYYQWTELEKVSLHHWAFGITVLNLKMYGVPAFYGQIDDLGHEISSWSQLDGRLKKSDKAVISEMEKLIKSKGH